MIVSPPDDPHRPHRRHRSPRGQQRRPASGHVCLACLCCPAAAHHAPHSHPPPPMAARAPKRVLPRAPGLAAPQLRAAGARPATTAAWHPPPVPPLAWWPPPLSRVALRRSSSTPLPRQHPNRWLHDQGYEAVVDVGTHSDGVLLHETDFIAHSLRLMEYYFILIQSPPSVLGSTVILV